MMLVPLSLVYSGVALMLVFCSIIIAESYLITGKLRKQNLNDSNCIKSGLGLFLPLAGAWPLSGSSIAAGGTSGSCWMEVQSNWSLILSQDDSSANTACWENLWAEVVAACKVCAFLSDSFFFLLMPCFEPPEMLSCKFLNCLHAETLRLIYWGAGWTGEMYGEGV